MSKRASSGKRDTRTPAQACIEDAAAQLAVDNVAGAAVIAQRGLQRAPRNADLWQIAAACAMRTGDYAEAERCWRQAVSVAALTQQAALLTNLGIMLMQAGRIDDAAASFQQALERNPGFAAAHFNYASLLARLGRWSEAEKHYRSLLQLEPHNTDALYNFAILLAGSQRAAEAEQRYRELLARKPDHIASLINLGALLQQAERLEEAELTFREAAKLAPRHPTVLLNLGRLLLARRRYDEAETILRLAVDLDGQSVQALISHGDALSRSRNSADPALVVLQRALVIAPDHLPARLAIADALDLHGRKEEARQALLKAASNTAQSGAPQRFELACKLLSFGCYREAWPLYEARLAKDFGHSGRPPPPVDCPHWQGESLQGRSLLLWPEQGYGDTLQFCRYVVLLKAQGAAHITLACQPSLLSLLASLPGIDAVIPLDAAGQQGSAFDFWCYLLSLPGICGTDMTNIPVGIPYLSADRERMGHWASSLPQGSPCVGLSWQGNIDNIKGRHRSLAGLEILSPLFDCAGIHFIDLQRPAHADPSAADTFRTPNLTSIGHLIQDFSDSAAVLAQLDLLISVDTAAAHLAGALGIPCLLLLNRDHADWRWLRERSDSPWYPQTMQLLRQRYEGDWGSVIEEATWLLQQRFRNQG